MIPSIRTFLLINLLLSVTLITSLAVIGNLFLEHKTIQNHLDDQLVLRALTIQELIGVYQHRNFTDLQKKIDLIPNLANKAISQDQQKFPNSEKIQFQVLDPHGKLLLHSASAPSAAIQVNTGINDQWRQNQAWRTYKTVDPNTNISVIVAERENIREELETQITRDSVLIMLISFPFLAILIWIIVGRGLDSLKKVTNEVSHREPGYLEPVDFKAVPAEITPMVEELNHLFVRLRQAFEREKRFAADAAHELRTPLAALKTQAQVASKAKNDEERDAALHKVIAGVDRSAHVVQQLLTFSRMLPETTAQLTPTNLIKQATDIIADLAPEAIHKNIEIELIAPAHLSMIKAIPTAISILLRNLVDNAIRYTPTNGEVKVIIDEDADAVILQVVDNGPGIPPELRERVFERFYRVLGNQATGSGLGLGIVQQIVDIHNAHIILDNAPNIDGKGLQVTIRFIKV